MKFSRVPYVILSLLCISILSSSYVHPIKLSSSLIKYNSTTKMFQVESNVFIDDFEDSINKKFTKDINVYNLSEADQLGIEQFFRKTLVISINKKIIPLKYNSSKADRDSNVMNIKFEEVKIDISKGGEMLVMNTLFFDEFDNEQTNKISFNMPPLLVQYNMETKLGKALIQHNF